MKKIVDKETGEIMEQGGDLKEPTGDKNQQEPKGDLPKVKNTLNYHLYPKKYKIFTQPSLTIPDQSMSMRELLERHTRGLDLGGISKEPIFEEEDMPTSGVNPKVLDLVDIENLKLENAQKIKDLQSKAQKHEQDKKNARTEAEIQKRLSEEKAKSKRKPEDNEGETA